MYNCAVHGNGPLRPETCMMWCVVINIVTLVKLCAFVGSCCNDH
jgi:hypothetical protein